MMWSKTAVDLLPWSWIVISKAWVVLGKKAAAFQPVFLQTGPRVDLLRRQPARRAMSKPSLFICLFDTSARWDTVMATQLGGRQVSFVNSLNLALPGKASKLLIQHTDKWSIHFYFFAEMKVIMTSVRCLKRKWGMKTENSQSLETPRLHCRPPTVLLLWIRKFQSGFFFLF